MEKLVYLLWRPADRSADSFRDRLLATVPTRSARHGAHRTKVCVTDSAVEAGARLHLGPRHPDALVSFWLDVAEDRGPLEDVLRSVSTRAAGYLVVESEPLRYVGPTGGGTRCAGFTAVGCIEPRPGMDRADFLARWRGPHHDVAIDTQHTWSYVRNEVVRPLTDDAPGWAAIVEEMFPIEALDDPTAFYDAQDAPERMTANSTAMFDSVQAFIDLATVDSHPMSEYRFG